MIIKKVNFINDILRKFHICRREPVTSYLNAMEIIAAMTVIQKQYTTDKFIKI